jgi:hypothetical protein
VNRPSDEDDKADVDTDAAGRKEQHSAPKPHADEPAADMPDAGEKTGVDQAAQNRQDDPPA